MNGKESASDTADVLLLGSGAREHALALKLSLSTHVRNIYVSPGNAGTATSRSRISNIALDINNHEEVVRWCKQRSIELVVVGSEGPLAAGIADSLNLAGVKCFGPSAKAALIEASKDFSKHLMIEHGIPTARYESFTSAQPAMDFINRADFPALVVKANGLAAGKGVIVAKDKAEACKAVTDILTNKLFGSAGETVIVEELLEGEEVSCLAFCDGKVVVSMPPAQDHKRLGDGDTGPNTGGMGAYCPCPLISDADLKFVHSNVLQKTVDVLKEKGSPFVGVLYAGVILTKDGPKVLEYNCRFGDPETQVVLPLMKSDLYEVLSACVSGDLAAIDVKFDDNLSAVGVVMASKGYPESSSSGLPITGTDTLGTVVIGASVLFAGAALDGDVIKTNGGRVLTVVATDSSLITAAHKAQRAASLVQFDGKVYRRDIGNKAFRKESVHMTYKSAGVDVAAGDRLVDSIKTCAKSTTRNGCTPELGGFGGFFDLRQAGYTDPLLVSGADGVGTKLKIAQAAGRNGEIGIDLVAMCVNDVLCHGAEPLFFLDYFACGKLDIGVARSIIEGVAVGCRDAGCALIGGETAEMPGVYLPGEYDLGGFCVGAVERPECLPRVDDMRTGDVVIGLSSSGLHSNGYSLVRKIVDCGGYSYQGPCPYSAIQTLGENLLTPTKIYVKSLLSAMKAGLVKGAAHITGGGLPGNVVRILPSHLDAVIDSACWNVQPVFGFLSSVGNVEAKEMLKTFNCGIGMVIVVSNENKSAVLDLLAGADVNARHIGHLVEHLEGNERVQVLNMERALKGSYTASVEPVKKKRVAVLISGNGSNLQALIDKLQHSSLAEISLVISNSIGAFGLTRAANAGIQTQVLNHKDYENRAAFDEAIHEKLTTAQIDIVCLAGFMRILTGDFVRRWQGRMLNIHPSLLPSFKGHNAHKLVIESGVQISGCTVHFVTEEVDSGAILLQKSVPVYTSDTEETLAKRVLRAEHHIYPEALLLLASGEATLASGGKITWAHATSEPDDLSD